MQTVLRQAITLLVPDAVARRAPPNRAKHTTTTVLLDFPLEPSSAPSSSGTAYAFLPLDAEQLQVRSVLFCALVWSGLLSCLVWLVGLVSLVCPAVLSCLVLSCLHFVRSESGPEHD